jgi:hypothetical protein
MRNGGKKNNVIIGPKVKIVKVPFVEIEKLRKLEIGYFEKHITLKVRVDKMKFINSKVGLQLAKRTQLSITLKVGLTFFCL